MISFLKKSIAMLIVVIFVLPLFSCSVEKEEKEIEFLIGISQANTSEPWRLQLIQELKDEAEKHPNLKLIFTDATDDTEKQKKDIDKLINFGIDLLIVSPFDPVDLTPKISDVYQGNIPVIVLDRGVEGYDYTLFIGTDNNLIGKQAAHSVADIAKNKNVNVIQLYAESNEYVNSLRKKGFMQSIEKHTNINNIYCPVPRQHRDDAENAILNYESIEDIDIIFAYNDDLALGAYRALTSLGISDIKLVGIDGFLGKNAGVELVQSGIIEETVSCPTGGKEAIQSALDILSHESGIPKQIILRSKQINKDNVEDYIASLNTTIQPVDKQITVGYAQLGKESDFRIATNNSIIEAAESFGINLIVIDGDQSQKNQIDAVNEFIEMNVDVIVISPIVSEGWDEIVKEVQDAGITLILSDRNIIMQDELNVPVFIGADFEEEGRRAMRWILQNLDKPNVKILEIQGTLGSTPAMGRKQGFEEIVNQNDNCDIVYSQSGDFTKEGGKMVMSEYLSKNPLDIDVIFAHNDDMALGACEALLDAGFKPGTDVKIVSVDGTSEALKSILKGEINCSVECSPLLGPQLMKAIKDLYSGKELPLRIITDEKVFTLDNANDGLARRPY